MSGASVRSTAFKLMIPDLIQLVFHYFDIDEVYQVKELVDIDLYLKKVECPTTREKSYRMNSNRDNYINWASSAGYLEVVKFLHFKKYPPNGQELWGSVNNKHFEITKFLLDQNYKDLADFCNTSELICVNNNLELLNLWIVKERKIELKTSIFEEIIKNKWIDILKLLDKHCLCFPRMPCIGYACQYGSLEILKYLEPYLEDSYPALLRASLHGQVEIIKYLNRKGYKNLSQMLHASIKYRKLETIKYLCEQGLEISNDRIFNTLIGYHRSLSYIDLEIAKYTDMKFGYENLDKVLKRIARATDFPFEKQIRDIIMKYLI